MPWYTYNPTGPTPYDAGNLGFYTNVGSTAPTCSGNNNFLCAIQASDISGSPDITLSLALEMTTALNNRIDTANVRLRPNVT